MSTIPINESGMNFGPYADSHCFHIEASSCYRRIREGVPMAEFLLLRTSSKGAPTVWIIEAKSSSPRPETSPDFTTFIQEIRTKLCNALMLGTATCLDRHPDAELPAAFKTLSLNEAAFRFVLVINGHKQEWLPPLQSALSRALRPIIRIWGLPPDSVAVLNHELALKHGLISSLP